MVRRARTTARTPIRRVTAELTVTSSQIKTTTHILLNDLTPTGVGLFLDHYLEKGEVITLKIDHPQPLSVKGEIAWCNFYSLQTKILSDKAYRYRAGVKFVFDTEEEKKVVQKYYDDLQAREKKLASLVA